MSGSGAVACPPCNGESPAHAPEPLTILCWPHLHGHILALPAAERGAAQRFVADHFASLAQELRELLRKSDWNNRHEPRGLEQDSWLRALRLLGSHPQCGFTPVHATPETEAPLQRRLESAMRPLRRAWSMVRPARLARQDIAGVKLEAALEQAGCPICRMAGQAARRWLFMLLWEGVMDPETRGRIRAAQGFCPGHWWQLHEVEREEMHSTGGIAILAEDTLLSLADQLRSGTTPPIPSLARCLACQAHRRGEQTTMSSAARHLSRPAFLVAYLASDGCCEPHRRNLARRLEDPTLAQAVLNHSKKA